MNTLIDYKNELLKKGYKETDANARLCQDVVLKALAESSLCRNATIKGGTVIQNISKDIRRATQDIDIDFIRYSLSDASIDAFIRKLNCLPNIKIERIGDIVELKQQDYHGKRVNIKICDNTGYSIESKIDLGVHRNIKINQNEYCFDVCLDDEGASLLINSPEQMIAEKLKSLLKFGAFSTRHRDVFDIYYLLDYIELNKLNECFEILIFNDSNMRENCFEDISKRLEKIFSNENYINHLMSSNKNWIEKDVDFVLNRIIEFVKTL